MAVARLTGKGFCGVRFRLPAFRVVHVIAKVRQLLTISSLVPFGQERSRITVTEFLVVLLESLIPVLHSLMLDGNTVCSPQNHSEECPGSLGYMSFHFLKTYNLPLSGTS